MRGLLPLLLSADAQHLIMSMGGVPYLLSPDATGAGKEAAVAAMRARLLAWGRWLDRQDPEATRSLKELLREPAAAHVVGLRLWRNLGLEGPPADVFPIPTPRYYALRAVAPTIFPSADDVAARVPGLVRRSAAAVDAFVERLGATLDFFGDVGGGEEAAASPGEAEQLDA